MEREFELGDAQLLGGSGSTPETAIIQHLSKINKNLSLFEAIERSEVETLEWLIEIEKIDLKGQRDISNALLSHALLSSNMATVETLLKYGCRLDESYLSNRLGALTFNYQNRSDQQQKLLWLDENYSDLMSIELQLFTKIAVGDFATVKKLISENNYLLKACLEVPFSGGYCLLHIVAATNQIAIAKWLIEEHAVDYTLATYIEREDSFLTASDIAAQYGYLELLTYLLSLYQREQVPLVYIQPSGNIETLSLLHHAAKYGQLSTLKFLIPIFQARSIPLDIRKTRCGSAFNVAVENGHLHIVEYLVNFFRKDIRSASFQHYVFGGESILHSVLIGRKMKHPIDDVSRYCAILSQNPIDIDSKTFGGYTPLHYAVFPIRGDSMGRSINLHVTKWLVELYLQKGFSISQQDDNGFSPLDLICYSANLKATHYLAQAYIFEKIPFDAGKSLRAAFSGGRLAIVQLLVKLYQKNSIKCDYLSLINNFLESIDAPARHTVCDDSPSGKRRFYLDGRQQEIIQWLMLNIDLDIKDIRVTNKYYSAIHSWLRGDYLIFQAIRKNLPVSGLIEEYATKKQEIYKTVYGNMSVSELIKNVIYTMYLVDGTSIIAFAIKYKRVAQIKAWLEAGASTAGDDEYGNTLLHYAVYYDVLELVRNFTSSRRISPLVRNKYGETPIALAARKGLLHLLPCFIDPNSANYHSQVFTLATQVNSLNSVANICQYLPLYAPVSAYILEELELDTWHLTDELILKLSVCMGLIFNRHEGLHRVLEELGYSFQIDSRGGVTYVLNATRADYAHARLDFQEQLKLHFETNCYISYFIKPLTRALRQSLDWLSFIVKLDSLPLEEPSCEAAGLMDNIDILEEKLSPITLSRELMESVLAYLDSAISQALEDWILVLNHQRIIKQTSVNQTSVQQLLSFQPALAQENLATKLTSAASARSHTDQAETKPLPLKPFPASAIAQLLKATTQFKMEELLQKLHIDNKEASSFIGNLITQQIGNYLPQPVQTLISTISFSDITQLVTRLYSHSNIYVFQLVYRYCSGDQIDWIKTLGFDQEIAAVKSITEFLAYFYQNSPQGKVLSYEKLCIALLKDEALGRFLNDDDYKDTRTALIGLAKQLKIPDFELEDIFTALTTLYIEFNKLPDETKEKINSYSMLVLSLLGCKLAGTQLFLQQIIDLLPKFALLIEAFVQPQVISMSELMQPVVQQHVNDALKAQQEERWHQTSKKLINFSTFFETSIQQNYIGILIQTPMGALLKTRRLEDFEYKAENIPAVSLKNIIEGNFKHFSLEGFSFKGCVFNNFSFAHSELIGCDFSAVRLQGEVDITSVCVDHKTAITLMKALYESSISKNSKLKLIGQLTLIGDRDVQLEPIQIDSSLEAHVTGQVNWCYGYCDTPAPTDRSSLSSQSLNPVINTEPTVAQPVESSASSDLENNQRFYQGIGEFISSYLPSTANLTARGKTIVGKLCQLSSQRLSTVAASLTATSTAVQKDEQEFNQELKTLATSSTEAITALKARVDQLEGVSKIQMDEAEQAAQEIKVCRKQIRQHQAWLKVYHNSVSQIHQYWENKQESAIEQDALLHHADPAVSIFYKTLLTELSGAFLSLFLLQNSSELVQKNTNKIYSLSNSATSQSLELVLPQSDGVLDQVKWFFEEKIKKSFFDSVQRNFGNTVLTFAKFGSPASTGLSAVLTAIPMVGNVISAVSKTSAVYVDYRESQKLAEIREEFNGVTPKTTEKLAELIARRVTQAYLFPISLLKKESAQCLARKGMLKIIISLLAGNGLRQNKDQESDIILNVLLSLRNFYAILDDKFGFAIDFNFLQQKLTLKEHPKSVVITTHDIFQQTGICYYLTRQDRLIYFSAKDGQLSATRSSLLGYMQVDESHYNNFIKGLIFDIQGEEKCRVLRQKTVTESSDVQSNVKVSAGTSSIPLSGSRDTFLTKKRAEAHQQAHQSKSDRYGRTIKTIFSDQGGLNSAKYKLKSYIQKAKTQFIFQEESGGMKLIISHQSLEKLCDFREQMLDIFWSHSFKKCITCDNSLIISFYLRGHLEKMITIFAEVGIKIDIQHQQSIVVGYS